MPAVQGSEEVQFSVVTDLTACVGGDFVVFFFDNDAFDMFLSLFCVISGIIDGVAVSIVFTALHMLFMMI